MLPIPFTIEIDPMERMLLVNFEQDPDSTYVGFEPQVFDDTIHGTGHIVLGWRVDGRVDVFHQPGITLDPCTYDIAGKGLANMVKREMKSAYFDVSEAGVQAYYSFHDVDDRPIEIKINEHNTRKRRPFSLLAPMGDAAENPSAIPLLFLHDFYFVRRKDTEFRITINGKAHKPDNFPMPLPLFGSMMYYTRYSSGPLIVTLNQAFDDKMPVIQVKEDTEITSGDITYSIEFDASTPVLRSIQKKHKQHEIRIAFEPAFPNLRTMPEANTITGSFVVSASSATGRVEGYYKVERLKDQIRVVMEPSGGWVPNPDSLTLRFIYTVGKIFKNWPKTYRWTASISENESSELHMRSSWERLK